MSVRFKAQKAIMIGFGLILSTDKKTPAAPRKLSKKKVQAEITAVIEAKSETSTGSEVEDFNSRWSDFKDGVKTMTRTAHELPRPSIHSATIEPALIVENIDDSSEDDIAELCELAHVSRPGWNPSKKSPRIRSPEENSSVMFTPGRKVRLKSATPIRKSTTPRASEAGNNILKKVYKDLDRAKIPNPRPSHIGLLSHPHVSSAVRKARPQSAPMSGRSQSKFGKLKNVDIAKVLLPFEEPLLHGRAKGQ